MPFLFPLCNSGSTTTPSPERPTLRTCFLPVVRFCGPSPKDEDFAKPIVPLVADHDSGSLPHRKSVLCRMSRVQLRRRESLDADAGLLSLLRLL